LTYSGTSPITTWDATDISRITRISVSSVVNVRIEFPFWDIISGVRHLDKKLWIMLSHKSNSMINFLKLHKRSAISCSAISATEKVL
jgi:hypothetical protein